MVPFFKSNLAPAPYGAKPVVAKWSNPIHTGSVPLTGMIGPAREDEVDERTARAVPTCYCWRKEPKMNGRPVVCRTTTAFERTLPPLTMSPILVASPQVATPIAALSHDWLPVVMTGRATGSNNTGQVDRAC
jgi:hypothetical protein